MGKVVEERLGPVVDVRRGGGEGGARREQDPAEAAQPRALEGAARRDSTRSHDLAAAEGEPRRRRGRHGRGGALGGDDGLRDEHAVAARARGLLVARLLAGERQVREDPAPDETEGARA